MLNHNKPADCLPFCSDCGIFNLCNNSADFKNEFEIFFIKKYGRPIYWSDRLAYKLIKS
jgi:hypothetical protein